MSPDADKTWKVRLVRTPDDKVSAARILSPDRRELYVVPAQVITAVGWAIERTENYEADPEVRVQFHDDLPDRG